MDYNDVEDFSGVGTYQYNPRAKRKSYAELSALANNKLAAKPATPVPAPAAPAAAAPAPAAAAANAAATQPEQEGTMGYGKILKAMNSPEAWEAGMQAGMARNDLASLGMMKQGAPAPVPYGGKKSWAEAAAEGLKTGIGMYDYLNSQKAKANALRKYQEIFDKMSPAGGMGTLKNVTKGELADLEAQGLANAEQFWADRYPTEQA